MLASGCEWDLICPSCHTPCASYRLELSSLISSLLDLWSLSLTLGATGWNQLAAVLSSEISWALSKMPTHHLPSSGGHLTSNNSPATAIPLHWCVSLWRPLRLPVVVGLNCPSHAVNPRSGRKHCLTLLSSSLKSLSPWASILAWDPSWALVTYLPSSLSHGAIF